MVAEGFWMKNGSKMGNVAIKVAKDGVRSLQQSDGQYLPCKIGP